MRTVRPTLIRPFCLLLLLATLASCTGAVPSPTATPMPGATASVTATPTLVPAVYLSELTPVNATVGAGSLGVGVYDLPDITYNGSPLRSHGRFYRHGLLAHAPSRLDYRLDGRYRLFRAQILTQDDVSCGDGVIFRVRLDEREVYASSVISSMDSPQDVELDVSGAQTLSLMLDMRQTGDCDWSIWGDPVLVPVGGVAADYPTATLRPTATLDPNLPCGGTLPERVYLFLDCSDIRRIRSSLLSGNSDVPEAWNFLKASVDAYRLNFPTAFDPDEIIPVLWNGGGYPARDMALVYLVTGDPGVAQDIVRLLDLVIKYTPNPSQLTGLDNSDQNGRLYAGGLMSYPGRGEIPYQSMIFAYLAVRDTSIVDAAQREKYDKFFANQAKLLEQAAKFRGNNHSIDSPLNRNVPFGANVSALTIALALPNDPDMQALTARLRPVLEWQLANWWEQDGGWGENTNNYGYRVFEGLLTYVETLVKNTGENIYETDFGGKSVHTMCTYLLQSVTPEGDPPQINDTMWQYFDPGTMMLCARRTNDPQILFAAQQYLWGYHSAFHSGAVGAITPFELISWWDPAVMGELPAPAWTSALLPSTGVGIFRSDWSHEAQYGLLKYTASLSHYHLSFGEIFLYDHGPWMTGNGYHLDSRAVYNQSIHTASSSTLTLDDGQQVKPGGNLLAFIPLAQTGYMAVTAQSYASLTHTRHVLWNQPGHQWIVVDDAAMSSPAGHKLQVRWYVYGDGAALDDQGNWRFNRSAYNYPGTLTIQMPSVLPATYTSIQRIFPTGKQGDANGAEIEVSPAQPVTRIVSVLTYSDSAAPSLLPVTRDDSGQGLLISTQPGPDSQAWDWLLSAPGTGKVERPGYLLQGNAGCVWRRASTPAGYCIYAGTSLNADGRLLAQSSAPISLEADIENSRIMVDSSSDTTLQIYWPTGVQKLTVDGQQIVFQQTEGMLSLQLTAGKHVLLLNP